MLIRALTLYTPSLALVFWGHIAQRRKDMPRIEMKKDNGKVTKNEGVESTNTVTLRSVSVQMAIVLILPFVPALCVQSADES